MSSDSDDSQSLSDDAYHAVCAKLESSLGTFNEVTHGHFLGPQHPTQPNPWQIVRRNKGKWHQKPADDHSAIKVKSKLYSAEMCQYFSALYNAYFELLTGVVINFIITPQTQPYVSSFEACMQRDRLLATLFDERPNIVDPMGGSGADVCSFLFNLFPREVRVGEAVFMYDPATREHEGGILHNNYSQMLHKFTELTHGVDGQPPPAVHFSVSDSVSFLRLLPLNYILHLLYLDPCWSQPGADVEMTPEEMAEYLEENVFVALRYRQIVPRCIVFKTRWGADGLKHIMAKLGGHYHAEYSVQATPFRDDAAEEGQQKKGTFHWVVIVHEELKPITWHRTEAFERLFKEKKDVTVLRSNLMRPNIPLYASRIREPVIVDHPDGDRTLTVKAPKLRRQGG